VTAGADQIIKNIIVTKITLIDFNGLIVISPFRLINFGSFLYFWFMPYNAQLYRARVGRSYAFIYTI